MTSRTRYRASVVALWLLLSALVFLCAYLGAMGIDQGMHGGLRR